jgi:hypothetical protein
MPAGIFLGLVLDKMGAMPDILPYQIVVPFDFIVLRRLTCEVLHYFLPANAAWESQQCLGEHQQS